MNVSEATRQLLRHLAFNLRNLGIFGIKLNPGVSLNFAVEQGWVELSWLQLRTQLRSAPVDETSGNKSSPAAAYGDPVRLWSFMPIMRGQAEAIPRKDHWSWMKLHTVGRCGVSTDPCSGITYANKVCFVHLLSVCLFVCMLTNWLKTTDRIFMRILRQMRLYTRKIPLNFESHPCLDHEDTKVKDVNSTLQ